MTQAKFQDMVAKLKAKADALGLPAGSDARVIFFAWALLTRGADLVSDDNAQPDGPS